MKKIVGQDKNNLLLEKDRKTERQKDRKTERQKDRKTERQKDRKTERKFSFIGLNGFGGITIYY
jgi:hypothetical protein